MDHKFKKVDDGYEYRGRTIRRNDDIPVGCWGRWSSRKFVSDTRADVARQIDSHIEDFDRGRKIFLSLNELPENCPNAMRKGFEFEAGKIRATTLESHLSNIAKKVVK